MSRTLTSLFDYQLPPERIAQTSVSPRDRSRLLLLDRQSGEMTHTHFFEIGNFLRPGDLLVLNETKVFRARVRMPDGKEIFLLRCMRDGAQESFWEALGTSPLLRARDSFFLGPFEVEAQRAKEGFLLRFNRDKKAVLAYLNVHGEVPTPPYVEGEGISEEAYQTVYAKKEGSVAAPTAGFHFTKSLLATLKKQGIEMASLTLHVGVGTFRPVKTETLEEHEMHAEWVEVSPEAAEAIRGAKAEGRRVIAVGTTTVRALEGIASLVGEVQPWSGDMNLFIRPGFEFKVIDGLITNFHLPKSTLLALVSAFAGREHVLAAYEEAIQKEYRFYSFGDAMLII